MQRERNALADALANRAMDHGLSLAWQGNLEAIRQEGGNVVLTADGGYRSAGPKAAAGWAFFLVKSGVARLLACGALLMDESHCDSFLAELQGLEIAAGALSRFANLGVCGDIVPHWADVWMDSFEMRQLLTRVALEKILI